MWHYVGIESVPMILFMSVRYLTRHFPLFSFQRPAYSTGILIPASFLCGIAAAGLIWRGGQKTKRTKEVEERLRQALAGNINSQECVRALNDDTYNAGAVTTHNDNAEEHHPSEDGKNSYADTQDVDKMTTPSTYRG